MTYGEVRVAVSTASVAAVWGEFVRGEQYEGENRVRVRGRERAACEGFWGGRKWVAESEGNHGGAGFVVSGGWAVIWG